MKHFFTQIQRHLRSDAHQSQIIGGDADVDHTQTIGGYSQRGCIPPFPPPPGFRHTWLLLFFEISFSSSIHESFKHKFYHYVIYSLLSADMDL